MRLFSNIRQGLRDLVCNKEWTTGGCDIQYRVIRDGSQAEVLFQWTVSKSDWKLNFSFWTKPYKHMRELWFAHAGFVKGYKSVRDEILALLEGCDYIQVRGYSQGGAFATLAHEDFRYHFPDAFVETITYGAPRVIWMPTESVRDRFAGMIRVAIVTDIVTHLPPALFGYRHVGGAMRMEAVPPAKYIDAKSHEAEGYIKALEVASKP